MEKKFKPAMSMSIEMLAVLGVVLVLTIAYLGTGIFSKKNVTQLAKTFDEIKTAQASSMQDVGYYAGQIDGYPFPDGLISKSAISDEDIKSRWRGPYLETKPVCPYANCEINVDFTTGAAQNQDELYQYFIVATNVPMKDAIELSRKYNGRKRVSECTIDKMSQVRTGSFMPCKIYLKNTAGGSNARTDVYYSFTSGTY